MLRSTLPADSTATLAIFPIAIVCGHLHLARGKPEALFAGLDERTRPYREAGFFRLLADKYWLRARAEMALEQYDSAREALLKAKEAAEAQGEQAVLWRILVSLAEVEAACGDEAAIAGFLNQASEGVDYITENAGELREIFLAQPDAEAALSNN